MRRHWRPLIIMSCICSSFKPYRMRDGDSSIRKWLPLRGHLTVCSQFTNAYGGRCLSKSSAKVSLSIKDLLRDLSVISPEELISGSRLGVPTTRTCVYDRARASLYNARGGLADVACILLCLRSSDCMRLLITTPQSATPRRAVHAGVLYAPSMISRVACCGTMVAWHPIYIER